MGGRGTGAVVRRYLPILGWLPGYEKAWLRPDLLAGLTVVALLVPEGMAYAQLAGMPPQAAFYAAPVGLVLYAVFGTSRQLIVAVSATVAVLSASTVGAVATDGSPEFYALTAMLALLAGAVSVTFGVLRLGRLTQFFSESVLTGFVFGLALVIAIKQVPKIFGIEAAGEGFFERLWEIVVRLPETHLPTLVLGAATVLLMVVLERRFERVPAALVVLVLGIAASALLDLEAAGVEVVGEVPAGLAAPRLPDVALSDVLLLLAGAFGIALVSFAEAIGPAQGFARKHGYKVDPDKELVGLGAANMGAGLFQGFPIGSSLSKSAANDTAGAMSQVSALVAAAATILVALFLTPLFRELPEATLGAIVVVAISGMMRVAEMRRLFRVRRRDFALALVALLGVLVLDVLPGLMFAVIVSLLMLVYRASRPKLSVMGRVPGSQELVDVRRGAETVSTPGLLTLRPNEGIFFANAESLREGILSLVESSVTPVRAVVLDLEMSDDLDVPATDALKELLEELERRGVMLALSRVHDQAREMLDRSGLTVRIGEDHLYPRTISAVTDLEPDPGRRG
jgi:sulfate permease, SulP family